MANGYKVTATQNKMIWKYAMQLPPDGIARCLPEIGLQARHMPATKQHIEQILIDCGEYCLRRLFSKGKWSRPHQVSCGAW